MVVNTKRSYFDLYIYLKIISIVFNITFILSNF